MRYKLTIMYDGTAYHGWQRQREGVATVQYEVEKALGNITECYTAVHASGRTDEGVHALGQVAHFDSDKQLDGYKYLNALNYYLPKDIRIIECEQVGSDFHARKMAKRKTYVYRVLDSAVANPLLTNRVQCTLSRDRLDDEAMKAGVQYIVGTHDFSAFKSEGSSATTFTRTIFEASVVRDGDIIEISMTGDGFLYNMVRIIVGVLIKIGKGQPPHAMKDILESGVRKAEWQMAQPQGLYLKSVVYKSSQD